MNPLISKRKILTCLYMMMMASSALGQLDKHKHQQELASRLLIIFNQNLPTSLDLANYYAVKRGIPHERVLGLNCSTNEEITREHYQSHIHEPIENFLTSKGWLRRVPDTLTLLDNKKMNLKRARDSQIWIMVLMRGIPLKIAPSPPIKAPDDFPEKMAVNNASVDLELATLPYEKPPLYGFIPNRYFASHTIQKANQYFADHVMMVCRLDGPNDDIVRRMIDDSIATESHGLSGAAFFDARGIYNSQNGHYNGDNWIRKTHDYFKLKGIPSRIDNLPTILPASFTMERPSIYAGWYTPHIGGNFINPGFRFEKGAVAYHIHSFSAATLRHVDKHWTAPLISLGAAATMGCVYEPYLQFTPVVPIFFQSLEEGFTFAEASYASQNVLSWMTTFVGDPLYMPFKKEFNPIEPTEPMPAVVQQTTHSKNKPLTTTTTIQSSKPGQYKPTQSRSALQSDGFNSTIKKSILSNPSLNPTLHKTSSENENNN